MDHIFKYKPTKKELENIFGNFKINEEIYLKKFTPDSYDYHLCFLFNSRKDKKQLNRVLKKLSPGAQLDFFRIVNHP